MDTRNALTIRLDELSKRPLDVVIVGSGPAGVGVAEYLYNAFPQATVAILERGDILTLTHVNNVFPGADMRSEFIRVHGSHPWGSRAEEGAMMIFAPKSSRTTIGGYATRITPVPASAKAANARTYFFMPTDSFSLLILHFLLNQIGRAHV